MRLTELLSPQRIGIERDEHLTKDVVLSKLAALLSTSGVSAGEVEHVLREREELQSTGIGDGVAIPHGALPVLSEQVAALLIAPEGVAFEAIDERPVTLVFAVVGPRRATGEHLKTLARVSRVLRKESFRRELLEGTDPESIHALFEREENGASPPGRAGES